eukprot:EG_transcript_26302
MPFMLSSRAISSAFSRRSSPTSLCRRLLTSCSSSSWVSYFMHCMSTFTNLSKSRCCSCLRVRRASSACSCLCRQSAAFRFRPSSCACRSWIRSFWSSQNASGKTE